MPGVAQRPALRESDPVVVNNTAEVARVVDDMMGSFSDMHVRLVLSGKNLGFAEGVNSGLPYCTQPYVLLLNDDAALEPGSLGILVSEMQRRGSLTWLGSPRRSCSTCPSRS